METTSRIIVDMTLSLEEARWLHAVMQNPLSNNPDPAMEGIENKKHRMNLWDSLTVTLGTV